MGRPRGTPAGAAEGLRGASFRQARVRPGTGGGRGNATAADVAVGDARGPPTSTGNQGNRRAEPDDGNDRTGGLRLIWTAVVLINTPPNSSNGDKSNKSGPNNEACHYIKAP